MTIERKVVYNDCHGGFGLSDEAKQLAFELTGDKKWVDDYDYKEDERHNETLVAVVEALGDKASGQCADLKIRTVSGSYRIDYYDGLETVETPDSYEWS